MGRPLRAVSGGVVYHVLNRANARARTFDDAADYAAFLRIAAEAVARTPVDLMACCVMPNHWHLVVRPREDGDLSCFTGWLTLKRRRPRHERQKSLEIGS